MKPEPVNAEEALSHLIQLMQHPGWALICARHELGMSQLKASVFDVRLSDEEANRIRHSVRAVEVLSPQTLASELETKFRAALKKQAATPEQP